jgi:probable selenium-dependent hydroxylase accessory protein YqeC
VSGGGAPARSPAKDGLLGALGVVRGGVVAVVGAGGKTSLAYRLAGEARRAGLRVVVTTTTHMGALAEGVTGPLLVEAEGDLVAALRRALETEGRATVLGRRLRADKLEGLAPERVDALAREADLVVVEADGARGRSLKAPADHEPVLPGSTTLCVVLAALDVLGEPLGEERVHRLPRVLALTGRRSGDLVDEAVLATTLGHPGSYPGRIPTGVGGVAFLNKVETAERWEAADRLARRLVPPFHRLLAGSARGGLVRVWA